MLTVVGSAADVAPMGGRAAVVVSGREGVTAAGRVGAGSVSATCDVGVPGMICVVLIGPLSLKPSGRSSFWPFLIAAPLFRPFSSARAAAVTLKRLAMANMVSPV